MDTGQAIGQWHKRSGAIDDHGCGYGSADGWRHCCETRAFRLSIQNDFRTSVRTKI